jgi:DNA replication and repair protein RecF
MDAALSQVSPSYYFHLTRYLRVVRQRNRLLKADAGPAALAPWDDQLAELGATIVERRREFVAALAVRARERHARIAGGDEQLEVAYAGTTGQVGPGGSGDERRALERALHERCGDERRRRTSLVGPHRDDLRLTVNGVDLRMFGSRGQQHTAALSLRLGEIELLRDELDEWPVVLLDDVLADLDPSRQALLLREVSGPQVLMTHTSLPDAPGAPLRHFLVRDGVLVEGLGVRP